MRPKALACVLPALFAVLTTALAAIAADDPPTRRELAASANNLKQIALAFHNHQCVYNHLPTDIRDKDGKTLLSWRVAILPFVEEQPLYKQFKLDEPWDSANNKKLIEKMPKLYAPIRVKAKAGETFYQVFEGENPLFGPKKTPDLIRSIPDGTSVTGMVFEGGEPVIWSKPADIPFDEKKPVPKLGGLFDGEAHVAMADGSVIFLKKSPDQQLLKYLIMPADGNPVDIDKLTK